MANNNIPNDHNNRDVFLGKSFGDDTPTSSTHSFWNSLKRNVIRIVLWTVAACVLIAVFAYLKNYRTRSIQTAFLSITSTEQLQTFANEYKKEPLAGVAYVQLADKNYIEGNYPLAASYYRDSLPSLKDTELEGRAQFGLAMSLLQNNESDGQTMLTEISQSPKTTLTIRSQALYQLFIISIQKKDYAQARQLLSTLRNLSENNPWADKAGHLESVLSELQNHSAA